MIQSAVSLEQKSARSGRQQPLKTSSTGMARVPMRRPAGSAVPAARGGLYVRGYAGLVCRQVGQVVRRLPRWRRNRWALQCGRRLCFKHPSNVHTEAGLNLDSSKGRLHQGRLAQQPGHGECSHFRQHSSHIAPTAFPATQVLLLLLLHRRLQDGRQTNAPAGCWQRHCCPQLVRWRLPWWQLTVQ